MRANYFYEFLLALGTLALFGCGWDCSFATEGKCLVTNSRTAFRHLSIETPGKYYSVNCGFDCAGSNKICFEGLPLGYTLISGGKDTIIPARIELEEGQTIVISNSGGDRVCASRKYIFTNNQLIEFK